MAFKGYSYLINLYRTAFKLCMKFIHKATEDEIMNAMLYQEAVGIRIRCKHKQTELKSRLPIILRK